MLWHARILELWHTIESELQAKNVDFVDDFLDNDDEFRQETGEAPRYSGFL